MKKLIYPERNRLLLKLSIPMFVSIIVIARYSTYPALPGFRFLIGPTPDDSIPYDIAIGYFSCYVFYLICARRPLTEETCLAWMMPLCSYSLSETALSLPVLRQPFH